jgi:transglutaminase-like putative cysteine protease
MNTAIESIVNTIRLEQYLALSTIIDWHHLSITELAILLKNGCNSQTEIAKNCFEWVRDNIKHSYDYKLNPVTCKASEVLQYKTGYCYAKSHLLAALLRANNIPAGLCYQRLLLENNKGSYCLHNLNAVYLPEWGWYRMDARGNKPGIDAQFCPPVEKLAFEFDNKREYNLLEVYFEPLDVVVHTLTKHHTYIEVYNNLPDVN